MSRHFECQPRSGGETAPIWEPALYHSQVKEVQRSSTLWRHRITPVLSLSLCLSLSVRLTVTSQCVRTLASVLRSLLDKFFLERYAIHSYYCNNDPTILRQGRPRHLMTHEVWYAIKERNRILYIYLVS